jgi:adenine-specific DNA-methyltransferase
VLSRGRRWITIDTSRVPLSLARQRLLTATFDWYELKDEKRGPASGFVYRRRTNRSGEDIGGIVARVKMESIANDEPPAEEVLVDRPEVVRGITRVTGPFTVEATIPTPVDLDGDGAEDAGPEVAEQYERWIDRLLDVLRRSPVIRLAGNREVRLEKIRPPAKALNLVAEATIEGAPVAIVAGPEHGVVSEKLVFDALQEARLKQYAQLLVIGFGIEPRALALVDNAEAMTGVVATYVQATPDLIVGPLLKTMRSSQVFSVCGRPEIRVERIPEAEVRDGRCFRVVLVGVDVFDPASMTNDHRVGVDVPCWMLDTDHDAMVFRAAQVFFPRTEAWNALARSLGAEYDPAVWQHLAGATSAPFAAPASKARFTVAIKVIDDRGNELLATAEVEA